MFFIANIVYLNPIWHPVITRVHVHLVLERTIKLEDKQSLSKLIKLKETNEQQT